MAESTSYPKLSRNTINRYKPRGNGTCVFNFFGTEVLTLILIGKYDYATIHKIVNTVPVVHVSFPSPDPEDQFPATLPMIGFMASFENQDAGFEDRLDLYLHGYVSSRLMRLGGSVKEGDEEGLPVTVAVSHSENCLKAEIQDLS